jgi:hypothetical protein
MKLRRETSEMLFTEPLLNANESHPGVARFSSVYTEEIRGVYKLKHALASGNSDVFPIRSRMFRRV